MKWSSNHIPDMKGKFVIVTGGNSGLGLSCVKVLSAQGANVVLACRNLTKGEKAKQKLGKTNGTVEVISLDLQHKESIQAFAKAYKAKYNQLDVLINNAGIMIPPFSKALCDVESQLGTNYLGHFVLTQQLMPVIKATAKARVVHVSSLAHRTGVINLDDINYQEGEDYEPMTAYRRSKLANLLFAFELQRYFESKGIDAISLAAHPGVSPTNLVNHKVPVYLRWLIKPLAQLFLQRVSVGALAPLRAAVAPDAKGGDYYGPCGRGEWRGKPIKVQPSDNALDKEVARALWQFSERVTGFKF